MHRNGLNKATIFNSGTRSYQNTADKHYSNSFIHEYLLQQPQVDPKVYIQIASIKFTHCKEFHGGSSSKTT